MAKVEFKRGQKAFMPQRGSYDNLYFTSDTNELFMGRGDAPLALMGSVYYGYTNLADLMVKTPVGITGKLYLTEDAKLYAYITGAYQLVAGSSTGEITSIEASKVTYDNTNSTLNSENVQAAIDEIATSQGKVKSSEDDSLGYLSDKVDAVTIEVVDEKLVVKSIDGLTVTVTDINQLTNITSNVQTQITDLKNAITAVTSGLTFGGVLPTYADLEALTTKLNGGLYIVSVDETKEDGRTLYVYSEDTTAFIYLGKFEFAESFTELLDTPNTYEADKYLMSDGTQIVYADLDYNNLINKPTSTVAEIDDAVDKKHSHDNILVLNKFSEDDDGNVLYDDKPLGGEVAWEEFNI